jgi:hypothetical protein
MRKLLMLVLLSAMLPSAGCAWLADVLFSSIFDPDRPVDPAVLERKGFAHGSREAGRLEAEENNVRRASQF